MKAETKCKRRGTLSLCGLGLLDETEVDSIASFDLPLATQSAAISVLEKKEPDNGFISEQQVCEIAKKLVEVSKLSGETIETIKTRAQECFAKDGITSVRQIPVAK